MLVFPSQTEPDYIYCQDQKQKLNVQIKISRFSFLDNLDKCLVNKNLDCKQVKYKMLNVFLLVLRRDEKYFELRIGWLWPGITKCFTSFWEFGSAFQQNHQKSCGIENL